MFFAAYAVYAQALGGIDGLPALPEAYQPPTPGGMRATPPPPGATPVEQRLQQAFGDGCPELKMPIKIDSPRGIVVASRECKFENGGREVHLRPISLAIFGKPAPNGEPEINTIRGESAILILDQPINGPLDMGRRRIIAADVSGTGKDKAKGLEPISIRNNRRTCRTQADDVEIVIARGPLHFDDEKRLIHTDDVVEMTDFQSEPPTKVTATGLDVHLASSIQKEKGKAEKPKADGDGNAVERVVLLKDVDMHLYSEPGNGFPAAGAAPAKTPTPGKPAAAQPKDHIHITTAGPFVYDLTQSRARFDIPDKPSELAPEWVTVVRNPKGDDDEKKEDRLECQHLELQLRRRASDAPAPQGNGPAGNMDIEWVHAWGNRVQIVSGEQQLTGQGNDLFYQVVSAETRTTILKGEPEAWLVKALDEIHARELELTDTKARPGERGTQQMSARGIGRIHLWDKTARKHLRHARWKEKFASSRDGELDVLTFVGDAALVEDEHLAEEEIYSDEKLLGCKSVLRADELQIWLQQAPAQQVPAKAAPAGPRPDEAVEASTGGRRVKRVEATGHVVVRSAELRVLERPEQPTQRLTLFFTDVPEAAGPPPPGLINAAPPPAARPTPAPAPTPSGPEPILVPAAPNRSEPPAKPAAPANPEPEKPRRPVDLVATFITAHIRRYAGTNRTEIEKLETEGAVRVIQPPSADDKGFDVRGDKLEVTRRPNGNHLKITGDLAELHVDRLVIVGPEVEIDQGDNTATVDGDGYMTMENTTDFQGNPLKKPEMLTVHWNKLMRFEGSFAEFHGNIQAEQANSHLTCQMLQVYFDRPISLSDQRSATKKEPGKSEEPARAKKLICDRNVKVEEVSYEVAYRLTDASLTALAGAGMADGVLSKLSRLKGKEFDSRDRFVAELAAVLTRDEMQRVQGLVVDQAAYEPQPRRLAGFKSLACLELTVWNLERTMTAEGPGVLRIVQPGSSLGTPLDGPGPKPPAKPQGQPEWTMTLLTYGRFGDALGRNQGGGRMIGDNNTHSAVFYEDVRVLHIPWTADPARLRVPVDVAATIERLPPGGLYMECREKLKIYSPETTPAAGQTSATGRHKMTGIGDVYVKATDSRGQVFWGSAEEVHYDEEKDQVIFDGKAGLAELFQVERRGDAPKKTRARKIIYSRRDGRVDVDNTAEIQGTTH
jgi:hypothetical protein